MLVCSGGLVPMAGTDMAHRFSVHPDFAYLTGIGVADAVLAFDAGAGTWELFCARTSADDAVWCQPAPEHGRPLGEMADWLADRAGGARVLLGDARWAGDLAGDVARHLVGDLAGDADLAATLEAALGELRLAKDDLELTHLRSAAAATKAGFDWVFGNVTAQMTERDVLIGMEAAFFGAGGVRVAYDSIVAAGANSAFLHYVPEATDSLAPPTKAIAPGDLLLIDAGAQVGGYAADVTRTMVVGAEPTETQAFLWQLIARTQANAIERCRATTEWREVHMAAAEDIASGLVEIDLLRGDPAELVASGAAAVFFPHGLGHLIGLAVHDAGGYPVDRERHSHPQLRYLRTDRPLVAGMVTSVEPGIYFIDALLASDDVRNRFADAINWQLADEMRGFGGIRIEDDVLVTDGDPVVLTEAIAKPMRIG